jgi:hypothetical protein
MSKSKEYVEKLKRVKIKYIYGGVLIGLVAIYGPDMAVGILLGMGLAYVAKKDIVE